jgi:ATP-dependent Clp protease ATP-binding subunit ClpB
VVLLDEIEKAHPDVFNTLLQVLDDGRSTDGRGRTVNFRNTVIIMTSNIGSEHLIDGVIPEGEIKPDVRDRVFGELRRHFRPEFLNRVDDIVLFTPLSLAQLERIVDLRFAELRSRLAEVGADIEITDAARRLVAERGFDPVYGARPLRRFISHEVETRIARTLVAGEIGTGRILVDVQDGELVVRPRDAERSQPAGGPR